MKKLLLVMSLLVVPLYAAEEIREYKAVFFLDTVEIGDIRVPREVASKIDGIKSVDTDLDRKENRECWSFIYPVYSGVIVFDFQAHDLEIACILVKEISKNKEIKSRVKLATLSRKQPSGNWHTTFLDTENGEFVRNK